MTIWLLVELLCLSLGPLVRRECGHLKGVNYFEFFGQNCVHHAMPFEQRLAFERFRDDHADEFCTAAIGIVFNLLCGKPEGREREGEREFRLETDFD